MRQLFYLLLGVFIFTGCSNDDSKVLNDSSFVNDIGIVSKPRIKEVNINVDMKLHRGEKWSRRNNVPPCTRSFGVCGVRIGVGVDVSFKSTRLQLLEGDGNFARISFLEDVGANHEDIFYSIDDDYFSLPQEIAEELGFASFTIIPDDYITRIDEEDPFGYVDIRFIGEPL